MLFLIFSHYFSFWSWWWDIQHPTHRDIFVDIPCWEGQLWPQQALPIASAKLTFHNMYIYSSWHQYAWIPLQSWWLYAWLALKQILINLHIIFRVVSPKLWALLYHFTSFMRIPTKLARNPGLTLKMNCLYQWDLSLGETLEILWVINSQTMSNNYCVSIWMYMWRYYELHCYELRSWYWLYSSIILVCTPESTNMNRFFLNLIYRLVMVSRLKGRKIGSIK